MATSTDSIYRLYNWYLGRHSWLHLLAGNRLLSDFPRLEIGQDAKVYEKQLEEIKFATVEK